MFEDGYRTALTTALDSTVEPGWSALVRSYRTFDIGLEDMLCTLVRQTGSAIILLAHADAVAKAAQTPSLTIACAGRPGIDVYLTPIWQPIADLADSTFPIPPAEDFAELDLRIQELGQGSVDMWRALGVTTPEGQDTSRGLEVVVGGPTR
nr:hypothetical protein KPHV_08340 [Kitasatospora purpeofusca]